MPLDEISVKILKALSEIGEGGCGDIGKKAGLDVHQVMGKLRSLKKEGLVDSKTKGKYILTEKGKKELPP